MELALEWNPWEGGRLGAALSSRVGGGWKRRRGNNRAGEHLKNQFPSKNGQA